MEAADAWLLDGEKRLVIDGRLVRASDGGLREVIEPASGAPLAKVSSAGAVDAAQAIEAARRAVDDGPWPRMRMGDRAARLEELSRLSAEDHAMLARIEARDSGRPLRETSVDAACAAKALRRAAQLSVAAEGSWRRTGRTAEALTLPLGRGVVVVAAGAHAPLRSAVLAVAPALAAGNAVIVLPDVRTPLTALRLGELSRLAGFPPGVLQVLSGGRDAGTALARADAVDLLAADLGVEREDWLGAARGARPLLSAPRAKGTLVVLNGADPVIAAEHALLGACYGQGALPFGVQRVIAERKVHDHLVLQLIARASTLTLGNPIDPDCELGPLASEGAREAVEAQIAAARAQGATLVHGGAPADDPRVGNGFFLRPALLVGGGPELGVWTRDVPGPLLLIHDAPDREHALAALPAEGPVGVFGASAAGTSEFAASLFERDLFIDTWNLPDLLQDPEATPWAAEDFTRSRHVLRAAPDGPAWYQTS